MTIDNIIGGHLWAIRYDSDDDNILAGVFNEMNDVTWLKSFFETNKSDLDFFHVDVNTAIHDTLEDINEINDILLDNPPDLDSFFMNLSPSISELTLQKCKGKIRRKKHPSWIRLYAIKIEPNIYVITGGTIKLTQKMQDREHTRIELDNIKKCRTFLDNNGIFDEDSLTDCNDIINTETL